MSDGKAAVEAHEEGRRWWPGWLVASGLIIPLVCVLGSLSSLPHCGGGDRPPQCPKHLSGLGVLFTQWRLENAADPPHNGPGLFLWFRKTREIRYGEEDFLLCPGDMAATFPRDDGDRDAYDALDPGDPMTWPPGCTSYAVRDFVRFPFDVDAARKQIVAADRCGANGRVPHHEGGVYVLYDNGTVRLESWEDLGFPEGGPPSGTVIVGPGSSNAELAKLSRPR